MNIKTGKGTSEYGPGIEISLTGEEIAIAIDLYLYSKGVLILGPRTTQVNNELCQGGEVYVDPSGYIIAYRKKYTGREGIK